MTPRDLLRYSTACPGTALLAALTIACSQEAPLAAEPAAARAVPAPRAAAVTERNVVVNGLAVSPTVLAALEASHRLQIADGNYWYDRTSGAAGPAGGPTLAFIAPGLDLGGPLAPDASAGNTGVFLNGRELPQYDLVALTRAVGFVQPGRYFLDANGNAGFEGGPPLINLIAASRQQTANGSGGDGWYSSTAQAGGGESGGTGYVMGKDASGNTWSASY